MDDKMKEKVVWVLATLGTALYILGCEYRVNVTGIYTAIYGLVTAVSLLGMVYVMIEKFNHPKYNIILLGVALSEAVQLGIFIGAGSLVKV